MDVDPGQQSGLSRRAERAGGTAQHRDGARYHGPGKRAHRHRHPRSSRRIQPGGDALLLPGQCRGGEPGSRSGRQRGRGLRRARSAQRHPPGSARRGRRLRRSSEDLRDRRHDRGRRHLLRIGARERRADDWACDRLGNAQGGVEGRSGAGHSAPLRIHRRPRRSRHRRHNDQAQHPGARRRDHRDGSEERHRGSAPRLVAAPPGPHGRRRAPGGEGGRRGRRHARPGARADVDRRAGSGPPCPQARADSRSRLEERWSLRCARSRSTGRR